MKNKNFLLLGIIVLLVVVLLVVNGIPYVIKWMASNCEINLTKISIEDTKLILVLEMKNNNPIALDVDALDYELFANDNKVGTGNLQEGQKIRVESGQSTKFEIPLQVSGLGVLSAALEMLASNNIEYHIKGTIVLNTMFGKISYPLDIKKEGVAVLSGLRLQVSNDS